MALSRVKYVVNKLMGTSQVARVGYLISGHNIATGYIMGLNPNGTCSVRLTVLIQQLLLNDIRLSDLITILSVELHQTILWTLMRNQRKMW